MAHAELGDPAAEALERIHRFVVALEAGGVGARIAGDQRAREQRHERDADHKGDGRGQRAGDAERADQRGVREQQRDESTRRFRIATVSCIESEKPSTMISGIMTFRNRLSLKPSQPNSPIDQTMAITGGSAAISISETRRKNA